ncbi:Ku protein [Streptomyces sp. NPDC048665]|uniref:Ku protein n=1 Tax=Streptomyces sp. NPDC048665 TaxID=3155490 RepID=UPI00344A648E
MTAAEEHRVRFHQYHLDLEDREVAQSEIGKGYELTGDRVIPITDEELSNLPLPTAMAIEIDAFVPLEDIDPIRMGAGYYLSAGGQVAATGRGGYQMLCNGVERLGCVLAPAQLRCRLLDVLPLRVSFRGEGAELRVADLSA